VQHLFIILLQTSERLFKKRFKKGTWFYGIFGGGKTNSIGLIVEIIEPSEELNIPWVRIISPTSKGLIGPYIVWVGRCELISRLNDSLK
jgi:hypothetical protein